MPGLQTRLGERTRGGLLGRDIYASHRTETHSAMFSQPPVLPIHGKATLAATYAASSRDLAPPTPTVGRYG
jgi:hypothetical protein